MIRYNTEKHCFEVVSEEEYMQERFDILERAFKKTINPYEPIRIVEDAKNKGRKEVWNMVRRLYLADEVENAYDLADLQEAFGTVTFSEILLKDLREVLAKDKERLKRIEGENEEEKIIRPGDEVIIDVQWLGRKCNGWVVDIYKSSANVLINTRNGVEMRYVGVDRCRKTGNTDEHLVQLVKAMKEEDDGAKNS